MCHRAAHRALCSKLTCPKQLTGKSRKFKTTQTPITHTQEGAFYKKFSEQKLVCLQRKAWNWTNSVGSSAFKSTHQLQDAAPCVLHAGRSDALTHSRSESHVPHAGEWRAPLWALREHQESVWTAHRPRFNRRVQFKPNFELSLSLSLELPCALTRSTVLGKLWNRFWTSAARKPVQQWAMKVFAQQIRASRLRGELSFLSILYRNFRFADPYGHKVSGQWLLTE